MECFEVKAHAKINLTLDVLGKRDDGYHEIEMVMQSIELHDLLTIIRNGDRINVTSNSGAIPLNEDNLVYKAAKMLIDKTGKNLGLNINIQKNIPVAAGLAGGSTDAAATLTGLNQMLGLGLSLEELTEIGALIGSDIPFCLTGGTALATGRGEIVTPLPGLPIKWLILAKPMIEVSTAKVYKNYDAHKVQNRPNNRAMMRAIQLKENTEIESNMANVLESVTLAMHPEVQKIKELMYQSGINKPLMSGSGPTVFGFVNGPEEAREITKELKKHIPIVLTTHTI